MAMTKPKSSQIEHRGESVQKVIDDLTQQDGVLNANPSWEDVPKLKGVGANAQALALANRTEALKASLVVTPEMYGCKGDGITDDTTGFAAWAARVGGKGVTRQGSVYRLTAPIDCHLKNVLHLGVILFDPPAPVEREVIRLTQDYARWFDGEIDGQYKANGGIRSTAKGVVVEEVEIHSLRSETSSTHGVGLTSKYGGEVNKCKIYDLFALGNESAGDNNGACRAIYLHSPEPMLEPFIADGNKIRDVLGEEGDAIQLFVYASSGTAFGSAADSLIKNNHVRGCTRRAIKVQAADTQVKGNDVRLIGGSLASVPNAVAVINIINSPYVEVTDNRIHVDSVTGLLATAGEVGDGAGFITENNSYVFRGIGLGAFFDKLTDSYIGEAVYKAPQGMCMSMGNCSHCVVADQYIFGGIADGTNANININHSNSFITCIKTVAVGGKRAVTINFAAQNSVFLDVLNIRDNEGRAITGASNATDTVVDRVITATPSHTAAVLNSQVTSFGNIKNLKAGGTGSGGWVGYISESPATGAANRYHQRGDIYFNNAYSATVAGWRCTGSGTPGTWVEFG